MRRAALAMAMLTLAACGGDAVNFDLDRPPRWLRRLDGVLPAQAMRSNEISANCFGVPIPCVAQVAASRSMLRKARFVVIEGREVRVTYTPQQGNPVVVSARNEITVPVRGSGGTIRFDCIRPGMNGCTVQLQ